MIVIRNISKKPRSRGAQLYGLYINRLQVCTFLHKREEPLWTLLQKAANAAWDEKENIEKIKKEAREGHITSLLVEKGLQNDGRTSDNIHRRIESIPQD